MATPHVSGAYALVKSLYPSASPQQIKARLLYSADKLESITGYTRTGRLNVFAALENDTISPGSAAKSACYTQLSQWIQVELGSFR